jgi:hypothetical protein
MPLGKQSFTAKELAHGEWFGCGRHLLVDFSRRLRRDYFDTIEVWHDAMIDKTYIVRFKPPETSSQTVIAAVAEVADEYLWMFKDGELVGLFAMEVVESWSEVSPENSN